MPHISGYGGSITIVGGWLAVPIKLETWDVNTTSLIFEGRAKGEAWKTKWVGPAKWEATVTCLVQHDAADGLLPEVYGEATPISNIQFHNTTEDYLKATNGIITGVSVSNPIDGPAKATYTITGTGAMTHVSGNPA